MVPFSCIDRIIGPDQYEQFSEFYRGNLSAVLDQDRVQSRVFRNTLVFTSCSRLRLDRSSGWRAVDSGRQGHASLHTPLVALLIVQHLAANMAPGAALPHSPGSM